MAGKGFPFELRPSFMRFTRSPVVGTVPADFHAFAMKRPENLHWLKLARKKRIDEDRRRCGFES
jgi:hypothetical protein